MLPRLHKDAQFDPRLIMAGLAFRPKLVNQAEDSLMAGADVHLNPRNCLRLG